MADEHQVVAALEAPRGMYPARLDDKGRLKLPSVFQQYFAALPEKKLFVTSLDRHIGRIYPMPVWKENEKFFDQFTQNPKASRAIAFTANEMGSEAEMDSQGRILVSPEMRRALGIENAPVHLYSYRGHVVVLSEAMFAEQQRQSMEIAPESLELLEQSGLK